MNHKMSHSEYDGNWQTRYSLRAPTFLLLPFQPASVMQQLSGNVQLAHECCFVLVPASQR